MNFEPLFDDVPFGNSDFETLKSVVGGTVNAATSLANTVTGAATKAAKTVTGAATKAAGTFTGAATKAAKTVTGAATKAAGTFTGAATKAFKFLYDPLRAEEIRSLVQEFGDAVRTLNTVNDLEKELDNLEHERKTLKNALVVAKESGTQLAVVKEGIIKSLEKQISKKKVDFEEKERDLQSELQIARKTHEDLKEKYALLSEKHTQLEKTKRDQETKLSETTDALSKTTEELSKTTKQFREQSESQDKMHGNLEEKISALEKEKAELQAALAEQQAALAEQQAALAEQQAALRGALQRAEKINAELEEKLNVSQVAAKGPVKRDSKVLSTPPQRTDYTAVPSLSKATRDTSSHQPRDPPPPPPGGSGVPPPPPGGSGVLPLPPGSLGGIPQAGSGAPVGIPQAGSGDTGVIPPPPPLGGSGGIPAPPLRHGGDVVPQQPIVVPQQPISQKPTIPSFPAQPRRYQKLHGVEIAKKNITPLDKMLDEYEDKRRLLTEQGEDTTKITDKIKDIQIALEMYRSDDLDEQREATTPLDKMLDEYEDKRRLLTEQGEDTTKITDKIKDIQIALEKLQSLETSYYTMFEKKKGEARELYKTLTDQLDKKEEPDKQKLKSYRRILKSIRLGYEPKFKKTKPNTEQPKKKQPKKKGECVSSQLGKGRVLLRAVRKKYTKFCNPETKCDIDELKLTHKVELAKQLFELTTKEWSKEYEDTQDCEWFRNNIQSVTNYKQKLQFMFGPDEYFLDIDNLTGNYEVMDTLIEEVMTNLTLADIKSKALYVYNQTQETKDQKERAQAMTFESMKSIGPKFVEATLGFINSKYVNPQRLRKLRTDALNALKFDPKDFKVLVHTIKNTKDQLIENITYLLLAEYKNKREELLEQKEEDTKKKITEIDQLIEDATSFLLTEYKNKQDKLLEQKGEDTKKKITEIDQLIEVMYIYITKLTPVGATGPPGPKGSSGKAKSVETKTKENVKRAFLWLDKYKKKRKSRTESKATSSGASENKKQTISLETELNTTKDQITEKYKNLMDRIEKHVKKLEEMRHLFNAKCDWEEFFTLVSKIAAEFETGLEKEKRKKAKKAAETKENKEAKKAAETKEKNKKPKKAGSLAALFHSSSSMAELRGDINPVNA